MTSDDLLDGDNRLYRKLLIIGGGVIGVEMATIYKELGRSRIIKPWTEFCPVWIKRFPRVLPWAEKERDYCSYGS